LLSLPEKSICKHAAKIIEPKLDDTQYGFRRGRSTTEQISLRQIYEKLWEHAKDLYACFVDQGKVYGRVPRKKLWRILWERGVEGPLFLAVK